MTDRQTAGAEPNVVYVLPDKMGGVAANVGDLLRHGRPDGFRCHVVLTRQAASQDTPFGEALDADTSTVVEHRLPLENLWSALRRLARAIPRGPGVLVANDWMELALLSVHDPGRTVIQILHGDHDYYDDLAVKHEDLVDAFAVLSRTGFDRLERRLPHRRDAIFRLPFGVRLDVPTRAPSPGPLRLLFVGRFARAKGLADLPLIDQALEARGVPRTWTLVGAGPDAADLVDWGRASAHVRQLGARPSAEIAAICAGHDAFVLPSRAEGLPRALLEAMAAGVVPVASDLPSGIRDVVTPGISGHLPAPGDVAGFADALAALHGDRAHLEALGRAARQTVVERFDVRRRALDYAALYARWRELRRPRPARPALHYGSRLDRPWLPNAVVAAARTVRRFLPAAWR